MLAPLSATAHGFGQRFDLPLPLWLWLTGAAATLFLTFALLALFGGRRKLRARRSIDLLASPRARHLAHGAAVVLRGLVAALFILALACGFLGSDNAYANLIVALVWVGWWVALAFVCALVGDLWQVIDPLRTIYRAAVRALRLPAESLQRRYPEGLGAWPAVVLFFLFAWIELLWADKDVPSRLAAAVLVYALITWLGMALFGVETWRRHGDAFVLAFSVLGRFAPLEVKSSTAAEPARLELRPYAAGLLDVDGVPGSLVVFVLLMLSTVTFDGFHQTPLMEQIETAAQTSRPVAEALFAISERGFDEATVLRTVLLLAFPLAFVLIFCAAAAAMLRLGTGRWGPVRLVNATVLTLVPIAVAYHLSHYFSLLLTTGQLLIPLASDPFGWGWDLFGTRGRTIRLDVVSPYVYWYGAVMLIVAGHVLSVVIGHVDAGRRFADPRAALRSQLPMLLLMVAYTCLSLWIMAQPIVG